MAPRPDRPIDTIGESDDVGMILIRDGWGSNPYPEWNRTNAIHLARTPIDDRLMAGFSHALIHTSGLDVGLPDGVMGNSEVGHQNIGAGRIVEQEIIRISGRIRDESFFENANLKGAFQRASETGGRMHVMGLCSDGRVHSDLEHLFGVLTMGKLVGFDGQRLFVHAFMDGRDTPPQSGMEHIELIERHCREAGINPVANVVGRYYAMDRDGRWDRVERAYRMLVDGEGSHFSSAAEAIRHYYDNPSEPSRAGDEFVVPSVVLQGDGCPVTIRDGDSVVFFNYRGDRPRELTKAFVLDEFPINGTDQDRSDRKVGFERGKKLDLFFVTMTAYEKGLPVHIAFDKPPKMRHALGAYIQECGLTQFRCAETEKYPHVTFFFSDYRDEPFEGEGRGLVLSPREITTYDQKPEMSIYPVTDVMLKRLATHDDDLIVLNFANGDMVGHTGNLQAAIRAVEAVDECVGKVVDAVREKGGSILVTADHGNCEQMIDPATGGPHTAHTTYDVELIVVDDRFAGQTLRTGGRLADIAPTALDLMGLAKPSDMTGVSLLQT